MNRSLDRAKYEGPVKISAVKQEGAASRITNTKGNVSKFRAVQREDDGPSYAYDYKHYNGRNLSVNAYPTAGTRSSGSYYKDGEEHRIYEETGANVEKGIAAGRKRRKK